MPRYPDFPLSLLPAMNELILAQLIFLMVLFNIFIVQQLMKINYSTYIPNNRFGRMLTFMINRYINMWSKTSQFIIIFAWVMIFICTIFLKIFMSYILS